MQLILFQATLPVTAVIQVVFGAKFNTSLLKNSLNITGTHNHVKTDLNVSDGKGRSIQTLEFERRKHPI